MAPLPKFLNTKVCQRWYQFSDIYSYFRHYGRISSCPEFFKTSRLLCRMMKDCMIYILGILSFVMDKVYFDGIIWIIYLTTIE